MALQGFSSSQLTPSQRAAVETLAGPLLIVAGPGSGKTRTVTHRIARLLDAGIDPRSILAVTFTNKAAREMGDRVVGLVGEAPVLVTTFHKFCARFLRSHAEIVGLQQNYTILDVPDQRRMMKDVLAELDVDTTHYQPDRVLAFVSNLKNDLMTPAKFSLQFHDSVADHFQAIVNLVYPAYQKALLASNAVDFDDLLMHVAMMLSENESLRERLSNRYQHVLIDEYQDTNAAQYRVAAALGSSHRNLCVTGDPDQSIYGWRGARIANILNFERDFPESKVIRLEDNFRSTKAILRTADGLIHHNQRRKSKSLHTENDEGTPVRVIKHDNGSAEADAIAAEIQEIVAEGDARFSDFAVFYRVNSLSREIEQAFSRNGVPYQIAHGTAFYNRAEVKDVLAYLRLMANPDDRTAFQRIINKPARRLGQTSLKRLTKWADSQGVSLFEAAGKAVECETLGRPAKGGFRAFAEMIDTVTLADSGSIAKLVRAVIDRSGYLKQFENADDDMGRSIVENVEEVIASAAEYDRRLGDEATLEGFLEEAALVSDTDALADTEKSLGQVTLMTLHAAKGLEFPRVYLVGLEQGLLPHERSLRENTGDEVEEERRLLFVGITRAEDQLTITHTAARATRGRVQISIQSQFLPELDAELIDRTTGFPSTYGSAGRRQGEVSEWDEPVVDVNADCADADAASNDSRAADGMSAHTDIDQATLDFADDESDNSAENAAVADAEPASKQKSALLAGVRLTTAADLLSGTAREVDLAVQYQVGQQVRHPHYGVGTVKSLGEVNRRRKVTVDFGGSEETMIVGIAPLKPA